ncbi:MAG: vanadium-dependent haloperoxidase [Candidatus Kapaibacterium sp.]
MTPSYRRGHPLPVLLLLLLALTLRPAPASAAETDSLYHDAARFIHIWNYMLTDIMVDEIRTPCNISRVYAYANIAAYEAVSPGFPKCRSLAGQLNGLTNVPKPDPAQTYDWRVAAVTAYRVIGDQLLFKTYRADSLYDANIAEFKASGVPADVLDRSRTYGEKVARRIIDWVATDNYGKITAATRYVIPKGRGLWEPTPPDFVDPVDPFWNTIRPFTMNRPDQFKPEPPYKFSTDRHSQFYKEAMEVYDVSKKLNDSLKVIPKFWDCNPIHSHHFGHLMFTTRQISPGGHWIAITAIAAKKKDLGMMESLETYTLVSSAMADAFISCWTEKYRSNVIRPVTYIKRYIDSTWEPYIQTPPFPEYSSGHSTISAAAAAVLTHMIGEMPFQDDTEVYLGTPIRSYRTFMEAAQEAAYSRMLGGIHYRHSNEQGTKNGVQIGEYVVSTIHTRV